MCTVRCLCVCVCACRRVCQCLSESGSSVSVGFLIVSAHNYEGKVTVVNQAISQPIEVQQMTRRVKERRITIRSVVSTRTLIDKGLD